MSDCSVKSSVWFGSYMGDAMSNTWLSRLGTHSAYTMHQWTVLFKATHACGACVFSCNLTPALLSESPGFLCATAKTGVDWAPKKRVGTKRWLGRRNVSHCSCWEYQTYDLLITSAGLYHWAVNPHPSEMLVLITIALPSLQQHK